MVRSRDGVSTVFNGKIGLTVNGILITALNRKLPFPGYRDIVFTVDRCIIGFFGSVGLRACIFIRGIACDSRICAFIRANLCVLCICTFSRSVFLFRIGGSLIAYRVFRIFIKVNIQIPCFSDNRGDLRVR